MDRVPRTIDRELKSTRRDLGWGVYELGDLRAYLAFSGATQDAHQALPWLRTILLPVRHTPHLADYSFSDLISLFVVRELLKKGVWPRTIRDAEVYLRRKWKTDRPFVKDEIKTDGRAVFVDDEVVAGGQIESADRRGQQVMREVISDRLTRVQYNEGSAAYWTPTKGVLVDPRVQFGEPVVEGTRVPTEAVAELAGSMGVDGAALQLGVSQSDALLAIAFEKRLAELRA